MNHHNINAIVYYLIVFIRYVLPITLVFIGIGRWSYAKSINNPEKQIMGVNFALKSILFLYIVTFIPIFIIYGLAMISKGGTHSGDLSMISFVEAFTLIEILAVGILPAYGFIQGYIYHYQWLFTEGKKTTSLPRRNLFIRLGIISPIAIVVFMEFLKRMFAY